MAPPAREIRESERALTAQEPTAAVGRGTKKKKKPSKLAMIRLGYEQLVSTVVRPPRVSYDVGDLGTIKRRINGATVERVDFEVENARGEILRCSKWSPNTASHRVILYLHSNSSCRLAVVRSPLLPTAASVGASLVSFDFAGCGISDGDVVTLGVNEADDIAKVVARIKADDPGARIVLWGRSMGAASALLYCGRTDDPAVLALVLDSPFLSLQQLADDVVQRVAPRAPRCGVACLLCCLRRSVAKRARGVNVMRVTCADAARSAAKPALFVCGTRDVLAAPKTHGEPLEAMYAGDSRLLEFDGEHNSPRPRWIYEETRSFLMAVFGPNPAAVGRALRAAKAPSPPVPMPRSGAVVATGTKTTTI